MFFFLSRSEKKERDNKIFFFFKLFLPIAKKRALTSIELSEKKNPDQQEESRKTRFASRAPRMVILDQNCIL
jgi:hypothetical protein